MANTTNFGWETPDDTDLVKDGALAMRTLGNAIDTSLVDLKGGTTGQVLSKNTNTDMDFVWTTPNVGDITEVQAGTGISVASGTGPIPVVTNTVATTFDAKGDLVAGTGADTFAKLTVGANNTVLTADSSTATGLKWATPAGGGDLILIDTDTFSSVTSHSVNDVFSATYKNYLMMINLTVGSQNDLFYRWRVSGSDNSTNNYQHMSIYLAGSSSVTGGYTTTTNGIFGSMGTNTAGFAVQVFNPNVANRTVILTQAGAYERFGVSASVFNDNTTFTGITIYTGGTNITGTISIYGYKE